MGYFFFILLLVIVTIVAAKVSSTTIKHGATLSIIGGVVIGAIITLVCGLQTIDNSKIGVGKVFGKTYQSSFGPGLHFIWPWTDIEPYDALRMEFNATGTVTTSDSNPLNTSVGFAVKLNPLLAWRIQEKIGGDYFQALVQPAGQTAVRKAIAQFGWVAATTTERTAVEAKIQSEFEQIIQEQFVANGLTPEEAKTALLVSPVQLRQALPDPKILNAVAEKTASQQDLDRQKTLTDIAKQEALRREAEGEGVTKLFGALPQGFSSDEIATVLTALATKTRADAMMKAVESNQVRDIIMNGDTATGPAAAMTGRPTPATKAPLNNN